MPRLKRIRYMNVRVLLLALAASAGLAACSSPTQSINFQAPSGWVATPSFFGFQAWRTADRKQTLVLFRLPVAVDSNRAMEQSSFSSFETVTRKKITICGKQPAYYIQGRGQSDRTGAPRDEAIEMIFTSYPNASYMALYARDVGVPIDSGAEHAIFSLCPKA